jgi:hypothetical protein
MVYTIFYRLQVAARDGNALAQAVCAQAYCSTLLSLHSHTSAPSQQHPSLVSSFRCSYNTLARISHCIATRSWPPPRAFHHRHPRIQSTASVAAVHIRVPSPGKQTPASRRYYSSALAPTPFHWASQDLVLGMATADTPKNAYGQMGRHCAIEGISGAHHTYFGIYQP